MFSDGPCHFPYFLEVAPLGSRALIYLAAAVSDFYVPSAEMAEHKIQSSNGVGLTLELQCVPKINAELLLELAKHNKLQIDCIALS